MKHRVKGKKLGRNTKQRKALFKSLISHLIVKGEVVTTLTKAKVIQRLIDKLITRAKKTNLHSRRMIAAFFNHKKITNKLVDELAPQMSSRQSGYTKITRLGTRRGDNSMMAKIEFSDKIAQKDTTQEIKAKKAKSSQSEKKSTSQKDSAQAKPNLAQQALGRIKGGQSQASTQITAPRTTNK